MSLKPVFGNQIKGLFDKVHAQHKTCALEFDGMVFRDLARQRSVRVLYRHSLHLHN